MLHGRGSERRGCSGRPTTGPVALYDASRRYKNHEISARQLPLRLWHAYSSDGRESPSVDGVCCLGMRVSRPVHAVGRSHFVRASPFPHLQLRYFSCVFLTDHVLDNDDDHELALGLSRSPRC